MHQREAQHEGDRGRQKKGRKRRDQHDEPSSEGLGARVGSLTGTVKWFDDKKGFGFIRQDNGGGDIFVHFSGIVGSGHRSLNQGDKVSFETRQTPKGSQAVNVRLR